VETVAQPIQSDERLVEQASRGDRRALAAIFMRYREDLFRYCAALLGNSEDAADALQSTMVKVLRALPGERRRIRLKPWLYRIAHNESVELLRKRRDHVSIDAEALVGAEGPESAAEARERLRQLLVDLRELPERQRGGLVMRELGGLSFEEIGIAFGTSAGVARQTVYEARIGLDQMELGRAMECEEVRRKISDGDRRVIRRRDVSAHLRGCAECRGFETAIADRRTGLAAISPISALAAAGLLKGALGGAASSAGGTAAGAGAAGSAIPTTAALKAVATVAVIGAIGIGAAERAGMVHVLHSSGAPAPEGHGSGATASAVARLLREGQPAQGHRRDGRRPPRRDRARRADRPPGAADGAKVAQGGLPTAPTAGSVAASPAAGEDGAESGGRVVGMPVDAARPPRFAARSHGRGHSDDEGGGEPGNADSGPVNAHGGNPNAAGGNANAGRGGPKPVKAEASPQGEAKGLLKHLLPPEDPRPPAEDEESPGHLKHEG
jgi:RNA polymerase sigma factor (sigma-70 family)